MDELKWMSIKDYICFLKHKDDLFLQMKIYSIIGGWRTGFCGLIYFLKMDKF